MRANKEANPDAMDFRVRLWGLDPDLGERSVVAALTVAVEAVGLPLAHADLEEPVVADALLLEVVLQPAHLLADVVEHEHLFLRNDALSRMAANSSMEMRAMRPTLIGNSWRSFLLRTSWTLYWPELILAMKSSE